jgi:regulatory protein
MRSWPEDRARRQPNDELARARDYVHRLLKFRPRSIHETKTRLRQRGFASSTIQQVVEYAIEHGWLDDAAFAKLWVRDRLTTKPKGRLVLKSELQAKGIARELIEQALSEADIDEEEIIQRLIEQKLNLYEGEDSRTRERKLYAFLRRRGFSPEAIRRALREMVQL